MTNLVSKNLEISSENILIVPGGKVIIFFSSMLFGEPGKEILYPNPGFPIYESTIRFSGAKPVPIPLREENGFAFSAEEVLSKINEKTRLIILNSPANPTGGVVPRVEFDSLIQGLERWPNVAIMSDEIYGQMLYDSREHVSLIRYPEINDRLILLYSHILSGKNDLEILLRRYLVTQNQCLTGSAKYFASSEVRSANDRGSL